MADDDQALVDEQPTAFQPTEEQTAQLAAPVTPSRRLKPFQPSQPFQPSRPTREPFQPTQGAVTLDEAGQTPVQRLATDIANVYAAETPAIPREEYGPAPRAYTLPELAARQEAERYGADFALRAHTRAQLVAQDEANRFAAEKQAQQTAQDGATAAAQAGQQSFVAQHAQAQVNDPITIQNIGTDLWKKSMGNFEALFNTARQGVDTDDLMINRAVDQMLPDGSPEDKAAFRQAFIAGSPDQRSQWLGALLPYTHDLDTAALSDALERKSDPALQAAKAKDLADSQARARANLEGDPRLRGTRIGNVISQVAALPAYAATANPLIAPVGIPMIFGRMFADSRQALADQHPDWNDDQLDNAAAETAIINTVGAEAGNRIIGAGLGPLLKNIRGGYLARAAVQVPATAAAQAAVGAGTQAATNIAQGQPVGQAVLEAALGQGIVGGAAGAIHATVRPPLAPETAAVAPEAAAAPAPEAAAAPAPAPAAPAPAPAPAPEVTTGPSGARIRGPEERTMETGAAAAQAVQAPPPPVTPPAPEPAAPPVAEAPSQRVERKWAEGTEQGGRRFRSDFEDRSNLTQDEALQLLELHSKFEANPSYEMTDAERALVNSVADKTILTDAEKDAIQQGRKIEVADFVRNQRNIVERYSRPTEPVTPPAVEAPAPAPGPRPVTATDILGPAPKEISPSQADDVIHVVAHNIFPDLSEPEAQALADRASFLAASNLETERLRYELQKFLPQGVPYPFGPTKRLLQSYRDFVDGPTTYTAKELQSAERAYNEARGPVTPAPGALKLPIMWQEVQARIPSTELPPPQQRPLVGERPIRAPEAAPPPAPEPAAELKPIAPTNGQMVKAQQGVNENEPWVSAIANRYANQRVAQGELGEIAPGAGYSRTDLRNVGLRMGPEEVNQHVSDLMQNKGDPKLQAAAVTAEEARLSQRSARASRIAEDNPTSIQAKVDAENAFKDLTDFHNGPVAKLKNNWHAQGMTLQGEVPVDLGSYNGLREAWLRDVGKEAPAELEPVLRKTAKAVRVASDAEDASMNNLGRAIEKTKTVAKSAEQVRNEIAATMGIEPCIR